MYIHDIQTYIDIQTHTHTHYIFQGTDVKRWFGKSEIHSAGWTLRAELMLQS